jgi:hypothetical protein
MGAPFLARVFCAREVGSSHLTPLHAADDNAGMSLRSRVGIACIFSFYLAASNHPALAQKGTTMSGRASGPFDVKLTPQDDKLDPTLGRMTIEKTLHGDLEATSKGQMLTASTDIKGSAGYVAIERVTGTLKTPAGPRTGSFSLQHFATLTRGAPELNIIVVPDSGTGQLTGLAGKMSIEIAAGKHSYTFDYSLPEKD